MEKLLEYKPSDLSKITVESRVGVELVSTLFPKRPFGRPYAAL